MMLHHEALTQGLVSWLALIFSGGITGGIMALKYIFTRKEK